VPRLSNDRKIADALLKFEEKWNEHAKKFIDYKNY
jgi:hypothetical protein